MHTHINTEGAIDAVNQKGQKAKTHIPKVIVGVLEAGLQIKRFIVHRVSLSPTVEYNTQGVSDKRERRLIKVDFSQMQDDDDEEDHWNHSPSSDASGYWPHDEYQRFCNSSLAAYDLATELHSSYKKHTLNVCAINTDFGSQSVPQSRPCSRQSCNSSEADSVCLEPEVCICKLFVYLLFQ